MPHVSTFGLVQDKLEKTDMLIAGTIVLLVPPVFVILYLTLNHWIGGKKNICIVLLGDVGRSPRMQYHALSFVKTGFSIDIVGYGGTKA